MLTLRLATPADLPAINDIYNHYVLHSTCTYQTEPETLDARRAWFASHNDQYPVTVATIAGQVVGWASISPFHKRAAYGRTIENSVYVAHDQHRKGIGRALLADTITRASALGYHTIIAGIDAEQTASIALHSAQGFTRVALLQEVGWKFNRWLHVIYMQRMLSP